MMHVAAEQIRPGDVVGWFRRPSPQRSPTPPKSGKPTRRPSAPVWPPARSVERQGWVVDLATQGVFGPEDGTAFARAEDWRVEADRILGQIPALGES